MLTLRDGPDGCDHMKGAGAHPHAPGMRSRRTGDGIVCTTCPEGLEVLMPPCVTGFAVLSVLALGLLSACGANDGQVNRGPPVGDDVPVTHANSSQPDPVRRGPGPDEAGSPRPSRSSALPPDTTTPDDPTPGPSASSTRRAEPTRPHPTVRTSTVIAVPVRVTDIAGTFLCC